jgi:hypothetical protein
LRRGRQIIANTIRNTRPTLSRLWRDYYFEKTDIDLSEMRLHMDLAKTIIQAHKVEAELKVADEVQEIKSKLKEKNII